MQVEKESKSAGLEMEDALNQRDGEWEVERLLLEWGKYGHPCYGDKPGSKLDWWWSKNLRSHLSLTMLGSKSSSPASNLLGLWYW